MLGHATSVPGRLRASRLRHRHTYLYAWRLSEDGSPPLVPLDRWVAGLGRQGPGWFSLVRVEGSKVFFPFLSAGGGVVSRPPRRSRQLAAGLWRGSTSGGAAPRAPEGTDGRAADEHLGSKTYSKKADSAEHGRQSAAVQTAQLESPPCQTKRALQAMLPLPEKPLGRC